MSSKPNLALCVAVLGSLLLPASAAEVYRCGNRYSDTPCTGGQAVAADDTRSQAQRQQALAVKKQDAAMAKQQHAERQASERSAASQGPARIGISEAQRAKAEALQTRTPAQASKKKPKKPKKPAAA